MATTRRCSKCGTELPGDGNPPLCPTCLLGFGLGLGANDPTAVDDGGKVVAAAAPLFAGLESLGQLGDYQLLEEIGRGGMGVVYKAHQGSLDRLVALKTIKLGPLASPEQIRRFRTEASAAASLQHPHIVAVHDVGVHQGHHFLAMDYVDGPNLARVVGDRPLGARRAATYLKAIAEAIHYAHERGILHRDLKPSNVLVDSEGRPRVADFGLARRLDGDSSLTLSGQVVGSPNYLPPEQGGGQGRSGRPADIYGLGAILYHLLTARAPFQAETIPETLKLVAEAEPVSPKVLVPSIPRDLETICLKCLEKEPAKRYPTAQAVAEELGRFLGGEPILARPVGVAGRAWRWCRRKPAIAAMAGTIMALLLTVTVVSMVATSRISVEARRAEEKAKELRRTLYVADMKMAHQALADDNFAVARELVRKYLPGEDRGPGRVAARSGSGPEEDLRGWEWRYLWQRSRGDALHSMDGHSNPVTCALFSPNGQVLVTASYDQTVRLWDVATKRTVRCLTNFAKAIQWNSVAWSPDGALLAVADGAEVHVFEPTAGNKLRTLPNPAFPGRMASLPIVFSADGRTLWCNAGGELRQWDTHSWERRARSLPTHQVDFGTLLAVSPAGQEFATGVDDGVIVWEDSSAGTLRERFRIPLNWPTCVVFSPDGQWLAATGIGRPAGVWEVRTGREVARLSGGPGAPLAFSPDGKRLALGSAGVDFWDLQPPALIGSLKGRNVGVLAFSPDGRTLVSGHDDGSIALWAGTPERAPEAIPLEGRPLAFSEAGRTLLLLRSNGIVEQRDVRSRKLVSSFPLPGARGARGGVAASPDGQLLTVVETNGISRVWDARTRQQLAEVVLDSPPRFPQAAFSPDHQLLAISCESRGDGGQGRTVVWDFQRQRVRALPDGDYYRPSFSLDGRLLATGSGRQIQLWTVPALKPLRVLAGHSWTVKSLAFSQDGTRLASTGRRGRDLVLWDVATGRLITRLPADAPHTISNARAFSPEGRTLASSGGEGATLWNLATGTPLFTFEALEAFMRPPMFSPDGNTLVLGGSWWFLEKEPVELLQAPSMAEIEAAERAGASAR